MTDIQKQLAEYERLIDAKNQELLKKQNAVHAFIDTEHKARETKKYQKEIRKTATGINDFIILLIKTKAASGQFKEQAEKLCAKGMGLNGLVRDISQALDGDLIQRQHTETVDLVKIAGVVAGLAAAAVTIAKSTFDPHSAYGTTEASAGASLGIAVAIHKKIGNAFRRAAKTICAASKKAGNIFAVYYAKEKTKEIGGKVIRIFQYGKTRSTYAVPQPVRTAKAGRRENKGKKLKT
ncbi:MAG: hypothetical protein PHY92_06490 [Alphaproteobacteria bacterium]|nr:hypothetical protein [Alphaproteobacteria bacterium]